MRLQSVRLHGFKSFADRTSLEIRDGVTAIIGSNGCGKSNVADAVRWVLGEQRASAIRGSKMEEVIFQGTARRRPLNFAEVSLLFDNQSGRVPVPQTELEVTRKVFREGGSEYSLNRNACRLRDVQNLLRDTGLGSNAYAIIEISMIERLLSDRAEERRTLFEEAAGIGRYKDSRQAATRRLDAAQTDLTRLDDLIAEVESKVRSLGRQKRKAERQRELQARRLDLEVAIARQELERLERDLVVSEGRRLELEEQERVAATERVTVEAVLETGRIEASDLGRRRIDTSRRLEELRAALDGREREILLADERRTHAEQRLAQLAEERATLEPRLTQLADELARSTEEGARLDEIVADARERAEAKGEANREIRSGLGAERAATEAASQRSREIAREIATAEAERAGTERRRRDALERQADLGPHVERLRIELTEMTDQTDLWATEADEVRERLRACEEQVAAARAELEQLRSREQAARDAAREAEDRLATLASRVDARDALDRNYEGFAPAVAGVMAARDRFPGVHGPLADYLAEPPDPAHDRAYEAYLGSLLQALVVEDMETVRSIRSWFRDEWREGGSLLLLPLDGLPRGRTTAPGQPDARPGTPWVELLLADLRVGGDPLAGERSSLPRASEDGVVIDARGVVRLTEVVEGNGILARRESLRRLRRELRGARTERDARLVERDRVRESLEEGERGLLRAEEERRAVDSRLKSLEIDAAAYRDRRRRLHEERDAVESDLRGLDEVVTTAGERLAAVEEQLEALALGLEEAGVAEESARQRLGTLEEQWDDEREREAELRVALARAESDLRDEQRRRDAAEQSRAAAAARLERIAAEAAEIHAGLGSLAGTRERASGEIGSLFEQRDAVTGELALLDARLAEIDSELAELGERARSARKRESEAGEERHQIELRAAEARSRTALVRERLEAEWGRPWSTLAAQAAPPAGDDPESWRQELRELAQQLDGIGPVNMLAVEEHAEEERRLTFLLEQRKDLAGAHDDLVAAIRQINRTAREVFQSTFETVRINFRRTFLSLFDGGECDIWLADPDDPLESPVEIQVSPRGKKTQRIHLLSGGERTLAALALLFALYLVKPSPFCVLDEVDAPLDDSNVGRFVQLLCDFKHETQFIVITHNPRTMEAADWVYGITMEEPGISSVVGVELLGAYAAEEGGVARELPA